MVHSATVCDLAIALAYTMLREKDPLAAAAAAIRSYHRHTPLDRTRAAGAVSVDLSRLAASVCYAAHNRARNPQDAYQVVTEAAAWDLLDTFERHAPDAATRGDPGRLRVTM